MSYSLYGSWSIEDSKNIGKKFKAICKSNGSYEGWLTVGKQYEIEIIPPILSLSPLCKGIGDGGKKFQCHLERFDKLEELTDVQVW